MITVDWFASPGTAAVPAARGPAGGRRYGTVVFLLLFWISFAVASALGQDGSSTDEHLADVFSQASTAQRQGDYRTAAKCYEEIVKLRPDVAEAWANLGLMHQFLDEYPQANRNFQIALGKNPKLYVPNLFLGLNQLRDRQPAAALRYLAKSRGRPQSQRQNRRRWDWRRLIRRRKTTADASQWFGRATEISPGDPDAWYGLGVAYLGIQDVRRSSSWASWGRTGLHAPAHSWQMLSWCRGGFKMRSAFTAACWHLRRSRLV